MPLAARCTGATTAWNRIRRANLDGSHVEDVVITTLDNPYGIALDVAAGKIYWTDAGTEKIQRANLDGSQAEDLVTVGVVNPRGLALDVAGGKMYWADRTSDKIQRANLDGSEVEDLVTPATSGLAHSRRDGLALDVGAGKMYWTERALGRNPTRQPGRLRDRGRHGRRRSPLTRSRWTPPAARCIGPT